MSVKERLFLALSLALLALGITLLFLGINASESFTSEVSRIFTGSPTDETLWLILGGIAASVTGFFSLIMSRGKKG